jgi:serine/threonine-protein kinase
LTSTHEEQAAGRGSAAPPDPLIGRLLLHYRVVEPIGQGGMSVVYRGRDEHLARDVAIKVLHPFLAEKPECRARLAREARAVARLEHPHIVKVFDFSGDRPTLDERPGRDEDDNAALRLHPAEGFIVAELVKGPTLKRFVERHSLWRSPELGALVVWQLLQALQHAHDNGVVHRDLKPENVMVRDDGVLKLMDFGIAQVADQGGLTITGTLLGSPAHMAPECIDGHHADERSDLFSMGTVLYWIATGALPFDAPTPHALLKQIVDGRATPAQQRSSRISDDLARVITKSLATRPADRFGSARAFGDALREVLEKSGLTVDAAAVTAALAAPADAVTRTNARVRGAFLARAQALLNDGATARALAALNRVLADDPADVDARALLDRVQADADPHADGQDGGQNDGQEAPLTAPVPSLSSTPDEVTAPSAAPARSMAPPTATAAASTATTTTVTAGAAVSLLPTAASAARRWQRAIVVAAAVGLVTLSVVVARFVDDAAARTAQTTTAAIDGPDGETGDGTTTEDAADADVAALPPTTTTTEPSSGPRGKKTKKTTTMAARELRPLVPVLPGIPGTRPAAGTSATNASATATTSTVARRNVTFRINPWADVVVDGTVVARNQQVFSTALGIGPHTVLFQNPRAKDHELKFDVVGGGPDPVITVRLEPRPALLSVRANQPDALVDVGGAGGIPAGETIGRPLVVALDLSRQEREVFIYKPGFVAYRRRHAFLAGETLRLDVVLEPDAGDAAPTPR